MSLNWPENQIHTIEEIEMVPSWRQKGTELLTKKAWCQISILAMASEPVKMSELMSALDYRTPKHSGITTFRHCVRLALLNLPNRKSPLIQAKSTGLQCPENHFWEAWYDTSVFIMHKQSGLNLFKSALENAVSYNHIARYFSSSIVEIAGE